MHIVTQNHEGEGGGPDDKFIILVVKLVNVKMSAFSQRYRTWPRGHPTYINFTTRITNDITTR